MQFVDVISISGDKGGWFRFNVTAPLIKWVKKQSKNLGLYLQIQTDAFGELSWACLMGFAI